MDIQLLLFEEVEALLPAEPVNPLCLVDMSMY